MNTIHNSLVKRYTVSVFGQSYTVLSDDPEEEITRAINAVVSTIQELSSSSTNPDIAQVTLLAAIKIVHQLQAQVEHTTTHMKQLAERVESDIVSLRTYH